MKSHKLLLCVGLLAAHSAVAKENLKKRDLLTWPQAGVKEFGCFLEKTFHFKDKKFNCTLENYTSPGNPCKDKNYYEGPSFPDSKIRQVDESIKKIDLAWEHGELQSVSITFKTKLDEVKARKTLNFPPSGEKVLLKNVQNIRFSECSKNSTCIWIDGFDHMGAGDVDCGS